MVTPPKAYEFFPQTNIPGYAGFIPRRLYDCGQTFGRSASPQIRHNVVDNLRERHWRKGPSWMSSTRAYGEEERPNTAERELMRPMKSPVKDGRIPVPRYSNTFEKPGYSGHIPMHADAPNTEVYVDVKRDLPGYTGHVPGVMNRMGRTSGMVRRMRIVSTPEVIPGMPPHRLAFSSLGGFRGGRPLTGAAGAPFATELGGQMERIERYGPGSRPGTGAERPLTGTRPLTGAESRPGTGDPCYRPRTGDPLDGACH